MCTRFVYRGDDTVTGFNFDIDPAEWDHKVIKERRGSVRKHLCERIGVV